MLPMPTDINHRQTAAPDLIIEELFDIYNITVTPMSYFMSCYYVMLIKYMNLIDILVSIRTQVT